MVCLTIGDASRQNGKRADGMIWDAVRFNEFHPHRLLSRRLRWTVAIGNYWTSSYNGFDYRRAETV